MASADALDEDDYFGDDFPEENTQDNVAERQVADDELSPADKKRKRDETDKSEKQKRKHPKKRKKEYGVDPVALFETESLPLHDSSDFTQPRNDEHLEEFVRDFLFGDRSDKIFSPNTDLPCGSPSVLVLTSSAIRAVTVTRLLRKVGNSKICKLFAKHMKIKDQVDVLRKDKFPIAVGTPNRVLKLILDGEGALKLDHLEYIVLDGTYKDQKQRTLFDIPELKGDLLKLLQILHKDVPQVRFCIYH